MNPILLIAGAPALFSPAAQEAEAPARVSLDDFARLHQAGSIDVAMRGDRPTRTVFTVRSVYGDPLERDDEHGYRTHLWLQEGEGQARQLTYGERGGSQPVLSPDGSTLAFVRRGEAGDGEGNSQVWLLELDAAGEARQLTDLEEGARNPRWLPDGSALIVDSSIDALDLEAPPYPDERWQRAWNDARAAEEERDDEDGSDSDSDGEGAGPAESLDALRAWLAEGDADQAPDVLWSLDFQGERGLDDSLRLTQPWIVPVAAPEDARALVDREDEHRGWVAAGGAALDPTGKRLAFSDLPPDSEHPDRVTRSSLYLLDIESGDVSLLLDEAGLDLGSPRWSLAHDQRLYFVASDDADPLYAPGRLAELDLNSSAWRWLTPERTRSVLGPQVVRFSVPGGRDTEEGRAPLGVEVVLFRENFDGRTRLVGLNPATGRERVYVDRPGALLAFGADGAHWRYAYGDERNPCEVYAHRAEDPVQVTDLHSSWLATLELAPVEWRPEGFSAPAPGDVQYWVMPPAELPAGGKAPTILSLHGGPQVMWGPGSFSMWHEWQWLCARGYGVVYVNPRGSDGYGADFRRANYRNWGEGPCTDVLAALDSAAAEFDWIDTDQLYVMGGSYAGYLTAWVVGHDQRFKAAAAQRGVYDLATFFGEGNAWRLVPWAFGGYPWEPEVRAELVEESPITYVEDIRTPLLILHASQDLRTGVSQSEMLYRSLKVLGRPVEYARYPGAGHDLSRTGDPVQRVDRLGRMFEFFERHR
ncbi:MAG: S9 family peptidase [Planctomycetota bacterium]|jgi:dipeptidyl aminopeptidase/acylaminoacyl peptidase